ncbi:MAG: hypothetical protein EA398_14575, partial [Deltaproteobacteria bacterium]
MQTSSNTPSVKRPFDGKRKLINAVEVELHAPGPAGVFDAGELDLRPGDPLVVDTERGKVVGRATGLVQRRVLSPRDFGRVVRRATDDDLRRAEEHRVMEQEAMRFCVRRIRARRLPMKLVRAEIALDRNRTLFYFSSEERVDFRQLVRDLATELRTRVELRQIGVRDGAGVVGGIGPCGKELCCSTFLREFSSISVRFAKNQGLSLNPQKVTGMCGRLKCCLVYEQPVYKELKRFMPKKGRHVLTPRGPGVVREVDLLARTLRVRYEAMNDLTWAIRDVILLDGPLDPEQARKYMSREQEVLERRRMRRGGTVDSGRSSQRATGFHQETYIWTDVEEPVVELADLPDPEPTPALDPAAGGGARGDGGGSRGGRRRRNTATAGHRAVEQPDGAEGGGSRRRRRRRRGGGGGGGGDGGSRDGAPAQARRSGEGGPPGGGNASAGQAPSGDAPQKSRRRRRRGGRGRRSGGDGGGGSGTGGGG